MIDIGINYTDKAFQTSEQHPDNLAHSIINANAVGVTHMIVTGTHVDCSRSAFALTQEFPTQLFSTAGVHPHYAKDWTVETKQQIKELLAQPKVVAVGETGLDFNRDFSPRDSQQHAFKEQLELAAEVQKPLFLHERDAFSLQYEMLKEYRSSITDGVVHCFTGTETALRAYLDLDLYIGITGWICDERRGEELQRIVKYIPDDRLLIETDGPYLLPRDLRPKPKSRRNEPKYLPHIAGKIAGLRNQTTEQLIEVSRKNSIRCFGLKIPVTNE
ncbi:MAG: TatD family hydrolase [Pseudomonadales bacterium]|nr:TatD family hydrolase [Pseudomonadales bacterium]